MGAQDYGVSTILNQDNQSTIKLSENGKASSGKGTWHINIRYFFITDRITGKEVGIQYCPTKGMAAAYYFTKPLQGELFYKFRDQIMGVVPMNTIGDHRSVLDHKVTNSVTPQKAAQSPRAQSKGKSHSWADLVKTRPPGILRTALAPVTIH
jgi:hypothetical protein